LFYFEDLFVNVAALLACAVVNSLAKDVYDTKASSAATFTEKEVRAAVLACTNL
jgi:hypothetical protein